MIKLVDDVQYDLFRRLLQVYIAESRNTTEHSVKLATIGTKVAVDALLEMGVVEIA